MRAGVIMMKNKYIKQIDHIIQEFDFKRVYKMMKAVNWKYSNPAGVPSIDRIKGVARSMLETCVRDNNLFASTGGFTAIKRRGKLDLVFGVDSLTIMDDYHNG